MAKPFSPSPPQQHHRGLNPHQPLFRLGLGRRAADNANHFVDISLCQQQSFDGVFALPRAGQQKLRSPADHRLAVAEKFLQQVLERQRSRLAVDRRQEVQREGVLQRRELVKLIEHDLGIGVAFQIADQSYRFLQVALVAHAGKAGNLALGGQRVNPLFDGTGLFGKGISVMTIR